MLCFREYMISLCHKHGYQLEQIANEDQTLLHLYMPFNVTVQLKGAKQVRILLTGNEKMRVIAMLCCTVDSHKLLPFPIFK